jgi:hypothetical protein
MTVREVGSLVQTRFSKAARGGRADAAGRRSASTARDCCEHAIEFLDALNALGFHRGRRWTLPGRRNSRSASALKTKMLSEAALLD